MEARASVGMVMAPRARVRAVRAKVAVKAMKAERMRQESTAADMRRRSIGAVWGGG